MDKPCTFASANYGNYKGAHKSVSTHFCGRMERTFRKKKRDPFAKGSPSPMGKPSTFDKRITVIISAYGRGVNPFSRNPGGFPGFLENSPSQTSLQKENRSENHAPERSRR